MTAIGFPFSNVYQRHVASCSLDALCDVTALIALFRAVQSEQALHDAHLHHPDNGTAYVAAQFYVVILHCRDDAAGAIDAADPVWHDGHQAGEFVAELVIHDTGIACDARYAPRARTHCGFGWGRDRN